MAKGSSNMSAAPGHTLNKRASGAGGPKPFMKGSVTKISAPAKPKMASMKSAHGKLIPGNC